MRLKVKQVFKSAVKPCSAALATCCVWLLAGTFGGPVEAASSIPASNDAEQQREVFEAAEELVRAGQLRALEPKLSLLQHYPLFPYLEAAVLRANFDLKHADVVRAFIREHEGTPIARQVQRQWLSYLAGEGHTEQLRQDYSGSQPLWTRCHYLVARLQHDENLTELWEAVTDTFLYGRSLPRACDPVLDAWADAGQRTSERVWQRLQLALDAGETGLASYLRRYLPSAEQDQADTLLRLYQQPAAVANLEAPYPGFYGAGIEHAIKRLRWQDVDQAAVAWRELSQAAPYVFHAKRQYRIEQALGIAYGVRQQPEQAQAWLEAIPLSALSETGRHWLLASYLQQQDFAAVANYTARMLEREPHVPQWLYWHGRARAEQGDHAGARRWLHQVARQRHYYGFMAAARLGLEPDYQHEPLRIRYQPLGRIAGHPSAQRAYELYRLERTRVARQEWNHLLADLAPEDHAYAAGLAYHWGWYSQSIYTFSQTQRTNDVLRRFPLGFSDLVERKAAAYDLNPAWLFAIARRESAFQRDAVSTVGARGLMQMLPETAAHMNRTMGTGPEYDLFDPKDNLRFSAQYLASLLLRFDQSPLLVTAAYNAGFGRVEQWLEQQDSALPADLWIELIPFRETRDYVKAVLSYQQIYAMQLGQSESVFNQLSTKMVEPTILPTLVPAAPGQTDSP